MTGVFSMRDSPCHLALDASCNRDRSNFGVGRRGVNIADSAARSAARTPRLTQASEFAPIRFNPAENGVIQGIEQMETKHQSLGLGNLDRVRSGVVRILQALTVNRVA